MYFNDTYGLPLTAQPTVYQRVPQVFNLAVNSWFRSFIGGLLWPHQRRGPRFCFGAASGPGSPWV